MTLQDINQTGKLTEKQREMLEKRKKELKGGMRPFALFILAGLCFTITIIGIPIGFILILVGYWGIDKKKKEIDEIEFQLASG